MLIDWLIYGLLIYGVAKLLNATYFKLKPASRSAAWWLTILIFFVSAVVLTTVKIMQYRAISNNIGISINPNNPLNLGGAFSFAWLFFHIPESS